MTLAKGCCLKPFVAQPGQFPKPEASSGAVAVTNRCPAPCSVFAGDQQLCPLHPSGAGQQPDNSETPDPAARVNQQVQSVIGWSCQVGLLAEQLSFGFDFESQSLGVPTCQLCTAQALCSSVHIALPPSQPKLGC
jgi:hypothetical protein